MAFCVLSVNPMSRLSANSTFSMHLPHLRGHTGDSALSKGFGLWVPVTKPLQGSHCIASEDLKSILDSWALVSGATPVPQMFHRGPGTLGPTPEFLYFLHVHWFV